MASAKSVLDRLWTAWAHCCGLSVAASSTTSRGFLLLGLDRDLERPFGEEKLVLELGHALVVKDIVTLRCVGAEQGGAGCGMRRRPPRSNIECAGHGTYTTATGQCRQQRGGACVTSTPYLAHPVVLKGGPSLRP